MRWHVWLIDQLSQQSDLGIAIQHIGAPLPSLLKQAYELEALIARPAEPWASAFTDAPPVTSSTKDATGETIYLDLSGEAQPSNDGIMLRGAVANAQTPDAIIRLAGEQSWQPILHAQLHHPKNGWDEHRLGLAAIQDRRTAMTALDTVTARLALCLRDITIQALATGPEFHLPVNTDTTDGYAPPPPNGTTAKLVQSSVARFTRRLRNRSQPEKLWTLAWRRLDATQPAVTETLTIDPATFNIIPNTPETYAGDPFLFRHKGHLHLFYEEYCLKDEIGYIVVRLLEETDRWGSPATVLRRPTHLSYPNVFKMDGDIWMLPETGDANAVQLYRATNFPTEWELQHTLLDDVQAADPTIWHDEAGFWMFANTAEWRASTWDALTLWHADKLAGPWTKIENRLLDAGNTRGAGQIFRHDGRILRPIQDCSEVYGGALAFAEITQLNRSGYRQQRHDVTFNGTAPQPPIHTYNRLDDIEVIDLMI